AREILDSRGNPTIEVDVWLDSGAFGRGMVPSGASTGKREAVELRDEDAARYGGKGVRQAVHNVLETIAPEIEGLEATEQSAVDFVVRAIERAGYRPGEDVFLAMDPAASEFGERGRYKFKADRVERSSEEMIAWYESLVGRYPICSIEDGLGEDDREGWQALT